MYLYLSSKHEINQFSKKTKITRNESETDVTFLPHSGPKSKVPPHVGGQFVKQMKGKCSAVVLQMLHILRQRERC